MLGAAKILPMLATGRAPASRAFYGETLGLTLLSEDEFALIFLVGADRLRIAKAIMRAGLASFTIDMPGSGENPVLYSDPAAERTYLTWLDHLPQRTDIDGSRVGVWGGSFGAYWAARLAFTAADRIKGAVFHGGNVHHGFQVHFTLSVEAN